MGDTLRWSGTGEFFLFIFFISTCQKLQKLHNISPLLKYVPHRIVKTYLHTFFVCFFLLAMLKL
jgi:hypothetical protein